MIKGFDEDMKYENVKQHFEEKISDDIKDFAYNVALGDSRYIFVTRDKEHAVGYCTNCHKTFEINGFKHNSGFECPECHHTYMVKDTRYGRKTLKDEACFITYEKSHKDDKTMIAREFHVEIDYSGDFRNASMKFNEISRFIFQIGKTQMYTSPWYTSTWWQKASLFLESDQGYYNRLPFFIDNESIKKAADSTVFKYSLYKRYLNTAIYTHGMLDFFKIYCKYPLIESLIKMGFGDMVDYAIEHQSFGRCVNYKAKDVFGFLKMNRAEVKEWKRLGLKFSPALLEAFRDNSKNNWKFTIEQIKEYADVITSDHRWGAYQGGNFRRTLLKKVKGNKVLKYIKAQSDLYRKEHYGENFKVGEGWYSHHTVRCYDDIITLWKDYYENCLKLNKNVDDIHVLMPKDIKKAHDSTRKLIRIEKNESLEPMIKKLIPKYEKYKFEYKGICTRAAESADEICTEGDTLCHCVATNYLIPYANGKTIIMFIRKTEEPNKPWITMEVSLANEVVQVYGIHDTYPPEEVREFVEEYKKQVLNKIKNKRKKVA